MVKCIYTADLHGNILQYSKFFNRANEENADIVIIGGDLLPKDSRNRTINAQLSFIKNEFIGLLRILNSNIKIFAIMGNDDFIYTIKELRKAESILDNFTLLNSEVAKISDSMYVAGYSYVPPTPFLYKDWEKKDLKKMLNTEHERLCKMKGLTSISGRLEPTTINDYESIQEDLEKLIKKSEPKKTIYVIHAPPFNTCLDIVKSGEHVGSQAIRRFIKQYQPLITLHGHIHETVEMSNNFFESIDKTLCMSPGNHHESQSLALIKFNTKNIRDVERLLI